MLVIAAVRVRLVYVQFTMQRGGSGAEHRRLQMCSRSVGRWEEQQSFGAGRQVAVEYHLVCAHPGA